MKAFFACRKIYHLQNKMCLNLLTRPQKIIQIQNLSGGEYILKIFEVHFLILYDMILIGTVKNILCVS